MNAVHREDAAARRATPGRRSVSSGAQRLELGSLYGGRTETGRPLREATVNAIHLGSALKLSFLTAVGLGVALVAGSALLWTALNVLGVFDDLNALAGELVGGSSQEGQAKQLTDVLGMGTVLTAATVIAVLNTLLLTLLGPLLAFIYNLMSALVGGLTVDLVED